MSTVTTDPRFGTRAEQLGAILRWYGLTIYVAENVMTAGDRADLAEWDSHDGTRTSDWAWWGRYIDLDVYWPWTDFPPPPDVEPTHRLAGDDLIRALSFAAAAAHQARALHGVDRLATL